jgi:histidinol-phosphate aminotransferase
MSTHIKQQRGVNPLRPYVPGTPIEEVQREYGIRDVIKLASNENPLGPSPKALAAIEKALPKLNVYPDGQSYYLRHALADHLGPGIDPEQIAVGNGVDGLILQTCMAYLDEECDVIVSCSSFPVYDIFSNVMRARLVKTPLKDFGLDLQAMARAINDRTKIIFVCNPNNPTGTAVTATEVDTLMAQVPEHVLVIFDEAYFELVDSDEYPDSLQYIREGRENVMTLRSFSKAYGIAGVRLGYAIATQEILAPLYRVKEPFSVNLLAQAAGLAALEDKTYLEETVAANHSGRGFFYAAFERMGLTYIRSHANFVLVEIGPEAVEVQQRLLRKGVIVRPCNGYDLPNHLRITVGTQAENARLVEALEQVL